MTRAVPLHAEKNAANQINTSPAHLDEASAAPVSQPIFQLQAAADGSAQNQKSSVHQERANGAAAVRQLHSLRALHRGGAQTHSVRQHQDYAGETVGVEQELVSDMKVKLLAKHRGEFGHVRIKGNGKRLANVTSDMGDQLDGYTIELRTEPYVAANEDEKNLAREAMTFLLEELKAASREDPAQMQNDKEKAVTVGTAQYTFQLKASNGKNYKITAPTDGANAFSNQVTVGVKTSDFLRAVAGEVTGGESGEIVSASRWLSDDVSWPAPQGEEDATDVSALAKGAYIALASAIHFAEGLFERIAETPVTDPSNKNLWGALPRNALNKWLGVLDAGERSAVLKNLRTIGSDKDENHPLHKAREYVLTAGGEFAGHPIPEFTIGGESATAFEYREAPARLGRHLIGDQIDPDEAPRGIDLPRDAMAQIMARRGGRDEYDSDEESEDW